MAYTRFFFLPWKSYNNLPTTPVFGGIHNNLLSGGDFGYTDPNTAMKSYAVTTKPEKVPLVETELTDTFTQVNPADYTVIGRHLKYPYYSISGNQCAYLRDQAAAGHPQNYVGDIDGPTSWQRFWRPWAKFSYELMGVTSINQADFFHFTGPGTGTQPAPQWYKGRRISTSNPMGRFGKYFEPWSTGGIGLRGAYIWRPNVGLVGILVDRAITGGYGPGMQNSFNDGYKWFGEPATYAQGELAGGSVFPTPVSHFIMWYNYSSNPAWYGYRYTVNGIQDHDLLVWEFWHCNSLNGPAVFGPYTPDTLTKTSSFIVGGGQSGQPLTLTNTIPNWAPSWGMQNVVVNGIEPSEFKPVPNIVTVGF